MRTLLAALLVLVLFPGPAAADELRPGFIALDQQDDGQWTMAVKTPLREFGVGEPLRPTIPETCRVDGSSRPINKGQNVEVTAKLLCDGSLIGQRIAVRDLKGSSEVFVRVAPQGESERVYRITQSQRQVAISGASAVSGTIRDYLEMGIEHILAGWDHLLFVIALVLLIGRIGPVVKAVTAFTVAHSITLIATTLDIVRPPARPVEALIALSIILVAIEIVKAGRGEPSLTQRFPWAVAFFFGLIHGFGFAGALREIGLPPSDVPLMLGAFNVGIELGQLAIIAGVLAARGILARLAPAALQPATLIMAYSIGITSSYWLVDRL